MCFGTRTLRFESWLHHTHLGKTLNLSGPQFLLENGHSFPECSTVLIEHLLCADRHPALGSSLLSQRWWHSCLFFWFGFPLTDSFAAPHASSASLSLHHYFQGSLTLCLQLSVNYLKASWSGGKFGSLYVTSGSPGVMWHLPPPFPLFVCLRKFVCFPSHFAFSENLQCAFSLCLSEAYSYKMIFLPFLMVYF